MVPELGMEGVPCYGSACARAVCRVLCPVYSSLIVPCLFPGRCLLEVWPGAPPAGMVTVTVKCIDGDTRTTSACSSSRLELVVVVSSKVLAIVVAAASRLLVTTAMCVADQPATGSPLQRSTSYQLSVKTCLNYRQAWTGHLHV
jgi:hypothetical protein